MIVQSSLNILRKRSSQEDTKHILLHELVILINQILNLMILLILLLMFAYYSCICLDPYLTRTTLAIELINQTTNNLNTHKIHKTTQRNITLIKLQFKRITFLRIQSPIKLNP